MSRLFNWMFGCWHPEKSWPISKVEGKRCEPYQRCLDCGKRLPYLGEIAS